MLSVAIRREIGHHAVFEPPLDDVELVRVGFADPHMDVLAVIINRQIAVTGAMTKVRIQKSTLAREPTNLAKGLIWVRSARLLQCAGLHNLKPCNKNRAPRPCRCSARSPKKTLKGGHRQSLFAQSFAGGLIFRRGRQPLSLKNSGQFFPDSP